MFRTMREAELMRGSIRPTAGFQFWSLVELETVWPWFHVETIDCTGDFHHKSIVLAPNVQLLTDLVSAGSRDGWVNQVQVVTPGSMNGTGSWKMEILKSLHEVFDNNGELSGHEYLVVPGKTYSTVVNKTLPAFRKIIYASADL
ncbi:hypothetical protein [Pseudomonas syringae]|uniref:hypothetical protein n=1 Tax=Pseudomonas syringae TaxID=317 RepID=UPI000516B0F5|nr:hypothetical protein [Pseudomonas syringae]